MIFDEDKYTKDMDDEEICASYENPAFWKEAERKELEYYATRIPMLTEKIKHAVKEIVTELQNIIPESANKRAIFAVNMYGYTFIQNKVKDANGMKSEILKALKPQLKLLKDKNADAYQEILKNIDNVFKYLHAKKKFPLMKNGTATNALTKINSRKNEINFDEMTGTGIIKIDGGYTVSLKNFKELAGLRTSTHKLLDALMIEFTETGGQSNTITLPLKKYMELRGLKDEKETRKQVKEDLETLYNVSISFKQRLKGRKTADYFDMRLVIDKGIKNGVIQCTFHPEFYTLMKGYQVMPMARTALALNDKRNPNAYYFLKELCEHMNMNYGKSNQNFISVCTLLKSTPEIPSYEEVEKNGNRKYKERIIEPFERDMEALEERGEIKFEYCHSQGLPLSNEELENMDYEVFIKLLIHFEFVGDYPVRELPEQKSKKKKPDKNT